MLNFDANSGAGTATQNVASFTSGAVTMTGSSVVIAGSSNRWSVGGSWIDPGNRFSRGTSKVTIASTGTVNEPSSGNAAFYDFVVGAGASVTQLASLGMENQFTINGTLVGAGFNQYLRNEHSLPNPLVFGPSGVIDSSSGELEFFQMGPAATIGVPSHMDYVQLSFGGIMGTTFNLVGPIKTQALRWRMDFLTQPASMFWNSNGYPVTSTVEIRAHNTFLSAGYAVLDWGTSFVSASAVNWEVNSQIVNHLNRSNWFVTGSWTNALTTAPGWDPGTSLVTMGFPTGAATANVQFGDPLVIPYEFYNLQMSAEFSTAATITMQVNGLHVQHQLKMGPDGSGTTTLATNNFPVVVGCLLLLNNGTVSGTVQELDPGCTTITPPAVVPIVVDTNLLAFVLALWIIILLIGFTRISPFLFLAAFVGMNLAYQMFLVFGDFIIPIVIAALNLVLLAYAIGTLMEDRRKT